MSAAEMHRRRNRAARDAEMEVRMKENWPAQVPVKNGMCRPIVLISEANARQWALARAKTGLARPPAPPIAKRRAERSELCWRPNTTNMDVVASVWSPFARPFILGGVVAPPLQRRERQRNEKKVSKDLIVVALR